MIPVVVGTALALIALAFVLFPLFQEELAVGRPVASLRLPVDRSATAIDALREIEFDHATGKLAEHDYEALKASYTQQALVAMRGGAAGVIVCGVCGPRPEANAVFCSECGSQLAV
jgi:hypothetical protein